jgi:UDP-glucuronate 4-epimerase
MKILVTGAAGFIGFHLSKALLDNGHDVYGIDNINNYYDINLKLSRLKELGISSSEAMVFFQESRGDIYIDKFTFVRMDLEVKKELSKLFEKQKFDIVCNLAAQAGVRYSIDNPDAYIQSNIVGFLNILECCRHNEIKHLLYASSSSVYGANKKVPFFEKDSVDHPISLYAATKKSNELMAHTYSHLYNIPTTGLRFFTVYGPWGRPDMAPMLFADAISNNRSINVFNHGDMSRDFTYIDDIVSGIELLLDNPPKRIGEDPLYRIFNIGNGNPQSLEDFINAVELNLSRVAEKKYLPMQPGDVPKTWADISKIKELGYQSKTTMKDGVSKFIFWFQQYYNK